MKKIYVLLFVFMLAGGGYLQAQIRIPVKKKTTEKTNEEIDKKIDEGLNKLFGKKKKKTKETGANTNAPAPKRTGTNPAAQTSAEGAAAGTSTPKLNWAKYDFVPGDKVIFQDNQEGEENGEFPSRWDLYNGTVENAQFGGVNVIMFRGGNPGIIPYLKNPEKDYLPDVFTVEFNFYMVDYSLDVFLYDKKNQPSPGDDSRLIISTEGMEIGSASSVLPDNGSVKNKWTHIAIAYTSGKLKAYMDGTRLINIPHLGINPSGITLYSYNANDEAPIYIRNFRIAEGGVKYYDRFLQDGKIITNGIRFETGKATLRPESMGVINKIYEMMKEHPGIRLSIEGHTDNVGDADFNQKLSEERALSVKNKLTEMGISADRLATKGFGETKPVDSNASPEGRANNRRVEFVKM